MYKYHVFGLDVESEVPIELATPADFESPDVRVRAGSLGHLRARLGLENEDHLFAVDDGTAILHWKSVGTVAVRNGDEVVIDAYPDTDPRLTSMALCGPPLGVLLHQRGHLVLHASAAVVDGCVAAFVGHKGFGKSTTVAAMHESGHPLFTDDILAIDLEAVVPQAFPGFSQLKLWPSAIEALFPDERVSEGDNGDKQTRPVGAGYSGPSLPVSAVFVLEAGGLDARQIYGQAAVLEVLRNSYASRFVGTEGTPPEHLDRCAQFVRTVPIYRLTRQPGLEALPEIVDLVVRTTRRAGVVGK